MSLRSLIISWRDFVDFALVMMFLQCMVAAAVHLAALPMSQTLAEWTRAWLVWVNVYIILFGGVGLVLKVLGWVVRVDEEDLTR